MKRRVGYWKNILVGYTWTAPALCVARSTHYCPKICRRKQCL